ncbi:ABC transporter substrate-binding protein [Sporosarcina sp. G11-34]|uniref:ABC transporter substrate-binding protein n=1 Tax=Sporosarcina sp. G11-34 TaxID=2849605 RepID=UPI0022A9EB74|nr:ABC transporter substrate-binding protein [Sporosarcina sp. G11-34]MCZ2258358.1 ABC transporter substrate-binding protein [Sporosarcina sp. G11-34]
MRKMAMVLSVILLLLLAACSSEESKDSIKVIKFADAGWDSIRVHNSIAQRIIEEGYGYETEVVPGSTPVTFQGLAKGDINVYMEAWTETLGDPYYEAVDEGSVISLSTNFDDNAQGLFVPTYVIEGDKERGIEPIAPDLRTVQDLEKYPELFPDPEERSKGRIVGAPSSWAVSEHLGIKVETYGLDEHYNYLAPGSDSAIVASLAAAYTKGEAWVGYYWSPTWVTAKYDLTMLEDNPYDKEIWDENRGTEFAPDLVTVAVHKDFPTQAEDVTAFLKNYETSNKLTEEALNYMEANETDADETAAWWMKEHEDLWTSWVPEDIAEKVLASLE